MWTEKSANDKIEANQPLCGEVRRMVPPPLKKSVFCSVRWKIKNLKKDLKLIYFKNRFMKIIHEYNSLKAIYFLNF